MGASEKAGVGQKLEWDIFSGSVVTGQGVM